MGQSVIWSFVVIGRCNVRSRGCRVFDAGGVSCGISLMQEGTVPKEKLFFILGSHVAEGAGIRVIVLPEGRASGKIGKGMVCWRCCLCDVICWSYFVATGS